MRLRLFDRIRRLVHPRRSQVAETAPQGRHRRDQRHAAGSVPPEELADPVIGPADIAPDEWPAPGSSFVPRPASRAGGSPAVRAGAARARIREAPGEPDARPAPGPPQHRAGARNEALARAAAGIPHQQGEAAPSRRGPRAAHRLGLPFAAPHAQDRPRPADGRRHCGSLERIVWRQWDPARPPPPEVIEAVDRLAELPERIKERLAAGLDAIFIGPGGVPELDEMTALRGVRLPSGQASWDACAGAYGDRKIVVGSQPSPTPDVMCHEVGHALDDLDSPPGKWQSDSAEFRMLYDQCQPHLASDFHRQPGGLGRKEFFADAFAAIASGQRPALVDMLSGDTRTALRVMLYFNRRYGI
ncbi:MAG TPA: hypothetical protein VGS06_13445 [Streptosporangiaceae bacterium]|nr:hypothetical protein [Streptosporangiaceae bacterium]